MVRTRLTPDHHKRRIEKLKGLLDEDGIETFLVVNSKNIFYLTGLSFIPTERPIILILHQGEVSFFVPSLEIDHVRHHVPFVSEVFSYFEYPDEMHPMEHFKRVIMQEVKVSPGKVASEVPGAPGYWGYKGPS
ncbi:MAG: aminopeptidase P family N-terminal domain-containing protein, partial [Candidatus Thorarchaeota archaeon]